MYQTVLASFRTAILLLISVAPAGNIGSCSCGILLYYPLCLLLRKYISGSFCFLRYQAIPWATSGGLRLGLAHPMNADNTYLNSLGDKVLITQWGHGCKGYLFTLP